MNFKFICADTAEVQTNWVIRQLSVLPTDSNILDVGAGEQRFKPYCSHLQYVAQDFGEYDGGGDGSGLQTGKWDYTRLDIVSDITRIPVDEASFDAILCSEVLEHIPDAVAAVLEFTRILKPGGTLLITAPFNSLTHFAPYHFCGYNRYWYMHHLPLMGLAIEEIEPNGSWFAFVAQELRRSRFVGRMYSSGLLGLITRVAAIPLLMLLTLLARYDRGSQELLCFGYMVRATKLTSGTPIAKSSNN
jgi:SAM-dependent methyltransferase